MDRPGDQPLDLPGNDQPQQDAEDQDAEAGGQGSGIEGHRQLAAGHQQQVAGRLARAGHVDHLVAAKLGQAPGFDMSIAFRQLQAVTVLQLGQPIALAVVDGRGPQGGIGVEFLEQGLGIGGGVQGLAGQGRVGHEPADGLQGLGGHAFLGNPVGRADKSQVGHQQYGGQQHQQGRQEFLADRQVF